MMYSFSWVILDRYRTKQNRMQRKTDTNCGPAGLHMVMSWVCRPDCLIIGFIGIIVITAIMAPINGGADTQHREIKRELELGLVREQFVTSAISVMRLIRRDLVDRLRLRPSMFCSNSYR